MIWTFIRITAGPSRLQQRQGSKVSYSQAAAQSPVMSLCLCLIHCHLQSWLSQPPWCQTVSLHRCRHSRHASHCLSLQHAAQCRAATLRLCRLRQSAQCRRVSSSLRRPSCRRHRSWSSLRPRCTCATCWAASPSPRVTPVPCTWFGRPTPRRGGLGRRTSVGEPPWCRRRLPPADGTSPSRHHRGVASVTRTPHNMATDLLQLRTGTQELFFDWGGGGVKITTATFRGVHRSVKMITKNTATDRNSEYNTVE